MHIAVGWHRMSSQVFLNVLIRKYPHGCSSGALCTSALGVHGEWLPEQTMQLRMSPAEPAPSQALRPISCCVHQTSKFSAQPLLKIMAQTPQKISSGKRTEQPAPFLLPSWHQAGFPRAASIPPPCRSPLHPLTSLWSLLGKVVPVSEPPGRWAPGKPCPEEQQQIASRASARWKDISLGF